VATRTTGTSRRGDAGGPRRPVAQPTSRLRSALLVKTIRRIGDLFLGRAHRSPRCYAVFSRRPGKKVGAAGALPRRRLAPAIRFNDPPSHRDCDRPGSRAAVRGPAMFIPWWEIFEPCADRAAAVSHERDYLHVRRVEARDPRRAYEPCPRRPRGAAAQYTQSDDGVLGQG